MPLTQKAADEAVGSKQIGPFAVRQVATQEYQKEWVASNKNSEDPTIAYAFPAYGFIDYQRQVIVVLQSESEASVQSPKPTVQSRKPIVQSRKPTVQIRKVMAANT